MLKMSVNMVGIKYALRMKFWWCVLKTVLCLLNINPTLRPKVANPPP